MCSKLTRKTPEQPQSRGSSVYIFNFERISNLFLVSVLFVDIKQANVSRVNMWNMSKVKNEDIRAMSMTSFWCLHW